MVGFHDIPAVELVPQHPVVEIGGVFHHVGGIFLLGEHHGIVDVSLVGHPVFAYSVEIGDHQVALVLPGGADQRGGSVGGDPVVAVEKLQVFARCVVQRQVPGGGDAGVFLVEHPYPAVLPCIGVAQGAGAVGAAVVHQEKLKVLVGLIQNTVHAPLQRFFRVVDRHDDTDGWLHRALL